MENEWEKGKASERRTKHVKMYSPEVSHVVRVPREPRPGARHHVDHVGVAVDGVGRLEGGVA